MTVSRYSTTNLGAMMMCMAVCARYRTAVGGGI